MGVVDTEDLDALFDPEFEDGLELVPEVFPVFRLEINGEDVLVFLGRVFGILHGAVRAPAKPGRVLLHPRVIGSALEGDVESHFHAAHFRFVEKAAKIFECAEFREDGFVAAFLRSDRPRAADVVAARGEGIVLALAELVADRVDGREVNDIEAHLMDQG